MNESRTFWEGLAARTTPSGGSKHRGSDDARASGHRSATDVGVGGEYGRCLDVSSMRSPPPVSPTLP